ncbi:MAG: helix-hairpin-helix domain-containing protein [Burkholderiaceae bacterium]
MAYAQSRRDRLAVAQGEGTAALAAGWDAARGRSADEARPGGETLTAVADTGDSTQAAGLASADAKPDDLTKVEGIGPKIAEHLQAAGIKTFAQLAQATQEQLQKVLDDAGPRYSIHKPDTWPEQAALAAAGKWDELDKLKDELDGGKRN